MNKLPKQWKDWCMSCGLKPDWKPMRKWSWYQVVGCGRYFRVCANGEFQISQPIDNFDRWANSGGKCVPMPKTKKEFTDAVKFLLKIEVEI